jgi:predicted oxidoreductase
MSYRGMPNWPPVWCRMGERTLSGELGILVNADCDRSGKSCYLTIDFENKRYLGTLLFSDDKMYWLITKILKNRIGLSIKEIGDLDLSYTL